MTAVGEEVGAIPPDSGSARIRFVNLALLYTYVPFAFAASAYGGIISYLPCAPSEPLCDEGLPFSVSIFAVLWAASTLLPILVSRFITQAVSVAIDGDLLRLRGRFAHGAHPLSRMRPADGILPGGGLRVYVLSPRWGVRIALIDFLGPVPKTLLDHPASRAWDRPGIRWSD